MTKNEKCDVCGSAKSSVFRTIEKHQYQECDKCGTIYLKTRSLNNQKPETYLDDPEGYLSIINPAGTRYLAGNVDHDFDKKVSRQKGHLLEIGAGLGFLSYTLFARGWEVESLELSKSAASWSEKVFKLPVSTKMIEDFKTSKQFDAVVMVEVLEHFYDPKKALKQIHKLLNKNSMLFGTTPNIDSSHWKTSEQNIYEPSDHIVLFNKSSLTKILKDAGYKNISVSYFGGGENNDTNLMYSAIKKR